MRFLRVETGLRVKHVEPEEIDEPTVLSKPLIT
jgi:hypothetical protein